MVTEIESHQEYGHEDKKNQITISDRRIEGEIVKVNIAGIKLKRRDRKDQIRLLR
jgi:hypothetical protein